MQLICPECKNEVSLGAYPNLAPEHVIECDVCGITLMVTAIDDEGIKADVVDEGK